jgi:pimeloyl-ACP methyl ester carboxylesterase
MTHGVTKMKNNAAVVVVSAVVVLGYGYAADARDHDEGERPGSRATAAKSGYAPVNGLSMYYEIHGTGRPLVLLHGGGSTIDTSFGEVLPSFAKTRQVIAFEQQGHGHTADVDRPFTFEQSADDAASLLRFLEIERADFFGYSNGGNIALQIGIRHPRVVRKLIMARTT